MGCLQGRLKQRDQASFAFVAATWPPNERQIKAKIYLEQTLPVIPVRVEGASPDSRTTIGSVESEPVGSGRQWPTEGASTDVQSHIGEWRRAVNYPPSAPFRSRT